jgi:deoxyribonuclease IV
MNGIERIGLHLRLDSTLQAVAIKAVEMQLPFFQCFFVSLETNKFISLTKQEIDNFRAFKDQHFKYLYLHGSYWINLSSIEHNGIDVFKKELKLAQKLNFTHMVLHAGSAKGAHDKMAGIDALARVLNTVFIQHHDVTLVLENTAHGNLTIGSDINDFKILLTKLDYPDRLHFCIDTAHAHAYGYDLMTDIAQNQFIALLDQTIGISRIALLHLNDTTEKIGSRIDRHGIPGQGRLSEHALRYFMYHPALKNIPIIMELPPLSQEQEAAILHTVRNW